jgi:gamma-glutamyltranspeptidase / glutathione hydrolase
MSPTIVEYPDGSLYLSLGAGGGSRIITSNIQNLWHILDQNMSARRCSIRPCMHPSCNEVSLTTEYTYLAEALAMPRFHDQLIPNQMTFEYTYDNKTVAYLASLGHNVSWVAPGQAHCQAIRRLPNGTFEAAGEPRMSSSGGYTY